MLGALKNVQVRKECLLMNVSKQSFSLDKNMKICVFHLNFIVHWSQFQEKNDEEMRRGLMQRELS